MSTKIDQPKGIIRLNYNSRARYNPKAPFLIGRISTPEEPQKLFPIELFYETDADGQSYYIGNVAPSLSLRGILASTANKQPSTHFATMRTNGFRVFAELDNGKPNPAYMDLSADQKAIEDAKPQFWGSWTRRTEDALLRFSVWDRGLGKFGFWASGTVQHPLTKDEADALRKGDGRAMRDVLSSDANDRSDEPPFPAHPDDDRSMA